MKRLLLLFSIPIHAMQQPLALRPQDIILIEVQSIPERPRTPCLSPIKKDSPRTPVKLAQIKSSTKIKIAALTAMTSIVALAVTLTVHFTSCK